MFLKAARRGAMFCVFLVCGMLYSFAQDSQTGIPFEGTGTPGTGFTEFQLGYYDNDDPAAGNPFLDEELTVVETVFIVDYNVTKRLALWGKFSYDNVAAASIARLSKFPDQNGASRDHYLGFETGARYEQTEWQRIAGNVSGSAERDYYSLGTGGSIERDTDDHNAKLKLGGTFYYDLLEVIRPDGNDEAFDQRQSYSASASWYQIINSKLHSELGTTLSFQSGFLETPYNAVVVEDAGVLPNPNLDNRARGIEVYEELPAQRYRGALFGRLRRYFDSGTSLELGGRLYQDSWGISGATLEPRIYQWIVPEVLDIRLRYRLYTQTESRYYDLDLSSAPTHRTQDSDLGDFSANLFGAKFTWQVTDTLQATFSGDYVRRNDGLDETIGSFGLRRDFQ